MSLMTKQKKMNTTPKEVIRKDGYWRTNIKILGFLMVIWFSVSFGAGILFSKHLDMFTFFGFPLGFWFSQQGAIYAFVIIIFVYNSVMKKVDQAYRAGTESDTKAD